LALVSILLKEVSFTDTEVGRD